MAIDRRGQDTQWLFERVCRALGEYRSGAHLPKIATDIIRPTHAGYELLGFVDNADRAAYYDPACGEVMLVRFDKHGLDRTHADIVAHGVDQPQTWLTAHRDRVVWSVRS